MLWTPVILLVPCVLVVNAFNKECVNGKWVLAPDFSAHCHCELDWLGEECQRPKCYYGEAVAVSGGKFECLCAKLYWGTHCKLVLCRNGRLQNGACTCDAGWVGRSCETRMPTPPHCRSVSSNAPFKGVAASLVLLTAFYAACHQMRRRQRRRETLDNLVFVVPPAERRRRLRQDDEWSDDDVDVAHTGVTPGWRPFSLTVQPPPPPPYEEAMLPPPSYSQTITISSTTTPTAQRQ